MTQTLRQLTLLVALSLAAGPVAVNGAVIFSANFESQDANDLGPSPFSGSSSKDADPTAEVGTINASEGHPRNVQVVNGATASAPDPVAAPGGGSHYIRSVKPSSGNNYVQANFESNTSDLRIEYQQYGFGTMRLRGTDDPSGNAVIVELRLVAGQSGGWDLQYHTLPSGTEQWTTLTNLVADNWYSLRIDTYWDTKTADIYVNGNLLANGTGLQFLDPTVLDQDFLFANGTDELAYDPVANPNARAMYLDNIVVQAVPEPATLTVLAAAGLLALRRRGT